MRAPRDAVHYPPLTYVVLRTRYTLDSGVRIARVKSVVIGGGVRLRGSLKMARARA
jgi:hypothetical protein